MTKEKFELFGRIKLLFRGYSLKDVIRKGFISFNTYSENNYDELRIPYSFLRQPDRSIVEHFGIEVCNGLDWALIYKNKSVAVEELLKIDPNSDSINTQLYQRLKYKIAPEKFSPQMQRVLPECCFQIEGREPSVKKRFNEGNLTISEIILNWDILKNKDLTYDIAKQIAGLPTTIDDKRLKELMKDREKLMQAIARCTGDNEFFRILGLCKTEEDENANIRKKVDTILTKTAKEHKFVHNDDYREFFKVSPITDHMVRLGISELIVRKFNKSLKDMPSDYLFTQPIPFATFFDSEMLRKITDRGLVESAKDCVEHKGIFASQKNGKNNEVSYLKLLRGDKNDRNER